MSIEPSWPAFTSDLAATLFAGVKMVPVPVTVVAHLSEEGMRLLRVGLGPAGSDVKWVAHLDSSGALRVWRTGSRHQVYEAMVSSSGVVTGLAVEQDPTRYDGALSNEPRYFMEVLAVILAEIRILSAAPMTEPNVRTLGPAPFAVQPSDAVVQAWSRVRLPFEPKGWLVDFRAELRAALSAMTIPESELLRAVYSAASVTQDADLENVLLYNVGSHSTRHLMTAGVIIERAYDAPAAPNGDPSMSHHLRYAGVGSYELLR